MSERLMSVIFALRLPIVIGWAAVLILLGYVAATQTGFTSDYRVYFSPDNPELLAYEAIEAEFTSDDNILIAVAPDDGDIVTADVLRVIEHLTGEAWQIPHAQRVDSLINFQHTEAVDGDLFVGPLVARAEVLSQTDSSRVAEIALNEPALGQH